MWNIRLNAALKKDFVLLTISKRSAKSKKGSSYKFYREKFYWFGGEEKSENNWWVKG